MVDCLIKNVHVVDVEAAKIFDLQDISVCGGVIDDLVPAGQGARSGGGTVVDARGGFAIPAIWDVHTHPGTAGPRDFLADAPGRISRIETSLQDAMKAGICGVRILGEALAADVYVREGIARTDVGPTQFVQVAGPALKPLGGHGAITIDPAMPNGSFLNDQWGSFEAHDEQSLIRAVELLVKHYRVDWVKIFVSGGIAGENETYVDTHMSEEQIRIVCHAAAEYGVPVAAHAGNPEAIDRAIRGGVHSIEHGYELSSENADRMAEKGVWYVPTISITHNERRMARMGWSVSTVGKAKEMQSLHRKSVENARASGVQIASGSDMRPLAQAGLEEVLMLREVGISASEALRFATAAAARLCGAEKVSGRLDIGKRADISVVAKDPLERIETILQPVSVINSGNPL